LRQAVDNKDLDGCAAALRGQPVSDEQWQELHRAVDTTDLTRCLATLRGFYDDSATMARDLVIAVLNNDVLAVRRLIMRGVDVNCQVQRTIRVEHGMTRFFIEDGNSVLALAAAYAHYAVVSTLLDAGATDVEGALKWACVPLGMRGTRHGSCHETIEVLQVWSQTGVAPQVVDNFKPPFVASAAGDGFQTQMRPEIVHKFAELAGRGHGYA
jgi:hypothetical protein